MTLQKKKSLDEYAAEIHSLEGEVRRYSAKRIVGIGKLLEQAKNDHPGGFESWIEAEFDWDRRTAQRIMSVSQCDYLDALNADKYALYKLAAGTTPEAAREEAKKRSEDGEIITNKVADEIIKRHRALTARREAVEIKRPTRETAVEEEKKEEAQKEAVARPKVEVASATAQEFILLSDWNELSPADKALALDPPKSKLKLNEQDTANIEWAQWSWNPITGCLHPCPYCYARDIGIRFSGHFDPALHPSRLWAPYNQSPPKKSEQLIGFKNIFVCSMADLFGKWVPDEWIEAVLKIITECAAWNFLLLTKFPLRLTQFQFPPNAWVGCSVDRQAKVKSAERAFGQINASVKWLSCEPLIEQLDFSSLEMFDWIVIGGASKSTKTQAYRPHPSIVLDLESKALAAGCKIYEKDNLRGERLCQYPGQEQEIISVPNDLMYSIKDQ